MPQYGDAIVATCKAGEPLPDDLRVAATTTVIRQMGETIAELGLVGDFKARLILGKFKDWFDEADPEDEDFGFGEPLQDLEPYDSYLFGWKVTVPDVAP